MERQRGCVASVLALRHQAGNEKKKKRRKRGRFNFNGCSEVATALETIPV